MGIRSRIPRRSSPIQEPHPGHRLWCASPLHPSTKSNRVLAKENPFRKPKFTRKWFVGQIKLVSNHQNFWESKLVGKKPSHVHSTIYFAGWRIIFSHIPPLHPVVWMGRENLARSTGRVDKSQTRTDARRLLPALGWASDEGPLRSG